MLPGPPSFAVEREKDQGAGATSWLKAVDLCVCVCVRELKYLDPSPPRPSLTRVLLWVSSQQRTAQLGQVCPFRRAQWRRLGANSRFWQRGMAG